MRVLGLIIAAVIAVGLIWGGGELHYRSCVDAAEAEHPVSKAPASGGNPFGEGAARAKAARKARQRELRSRRNALDDCSRLPW